MFPHVDAEVNNTIHNVDEINDVSLFDNIPDELKTYRQWVCWRKVPKPDGTGFTKIPLDAKTGSKAKVDDATTFAPYHRVVESYSNGVGDGIGFVFVAGDPYCGIDLDHCRDPQTGYVEPWGSEILVRCDSYTEASPSGDGVHILGKGTLAGKGGNDLKGFEIYDRGRFFTFTGEHIGGTSTTIEDRQDVINALYREHFPHKGNGKPSHNCAASHFSDAERAAIVADLKDALPYIPAIEHETWLHVGMGLHSVDSGPSGFDVWVRWSQTCAEKFNLADCEKRWRSFHDDGGITHKTIFALAIERGWTNGATSPPEATWGDEATFAVPPTDHFRCTDLGNGERFIARYGADLRYCNQWKKYLTWDGKRWELDNRQTVRQWARLTVRAMYDETQRLTKQAKDADAGEPKETLVKRATALLQHAVKSEAEARLNATISLAQMDCAVLPDQLDVDPWLLNVANGTLDLRTGELRPHRRDDLLTKIIPLAYDPEAQCPQWESFLAAIMDGSEELFDFLQRAIGYSLTGDTREDCLFLLHGTGANGKSTFQTILRTLGGDYGRQAEFSTFLHRDRDVVRNDLADLRGARLVTAGETEQDKRLSEAVVKQLTGRDAVKARFLFQEYFEFMPQLKIWLAANHKPVIRGRDYAIWRRIRLVPFTQKFEGTNRDADLPAKLATELPGILAWAVRGCLAWQKEGLPTPKAVQVATDDYRKEMDTIGNFLEECCEQKPHLRVKAGDLYNAYVKWSGDKHMTQTAFGRELTERGIEKDKGRSAVWRLGVALLDLDSVDG